MADRGLDALPPEDRRLSPLTGRTRAHWERIADVLFVQLVAAERVDRALGPLRLEGAVRFARVSPDGSSFTHRD